MLYQLLVLLDLWIFALLSVAVEGYGGAVTGEIVDDIRNMGIVFQDIPYSSYDDVVIVI